MDSRFRRLGIAHPVESSLLAWAGVHDAPPLLCEVTEVSCIADAGDTHQRSLDIGDLHVAFGASVGWHRRDVGGV